MSWGEQPTLSGQHVTLRPLTRDDRAGLLTAFATLDHVYATQVPTPETFDSWFDGLERETAETVHERMTAISGIGPWTADIYLLFCLGHRDGFAAGDLAIQEAARQAFGLAERPKPAELQAMAEAWRPWRGVAARLLWAYYAVLKRREGINA